MTSSSNNLGSNAILISNTSFPKDENLADLPENNDANLITALLQDKAILGLPEENITVLENVLHNTSIKEALANTVEKTTEKLFVYYNGYIVIHKEALFLTTINSTINKAHINAISLQSLVEIASETKAIQVVFLFDVKYIQNADETVSQLDKLIKGQFSQFEKEFQNAIFLSPSVSQNYKSAEENTISFTAILTDLITKGLPNENKELSVSDLCNPLEKLLTQNNLPKALKGKKTKKNISKVAFNKMYMEFSVLKEEADTFFDANEFSQALPIYQKAQELYQDNQEIAIKIATINILASADEFSRAADFYNARASYEQAYKLLRTSYIREKIVQSLEKLADEFYYKEEYDMAKTYYEKLLVKEASSEFYSKMLEICSEELLFTSHLDEGDEYYFAYDYENALVHYKRALKINYDSRILKRKDVCEHFLAKEAAIKVAAEKEITAEVTANYKDDLEIEILQKEKEIEERLKPILREEISNELNDNFTVEMRSLLKKELWEETKARVQTELKPRIWEEAKTRISHDLENAFWKNISEKPSLELLAFYQSFFADGGRYLEEAQKFSDILEKAQKEKQQQKKEEVENETSKIIEATSTASKAEETIEPPKEMDFQKLEDTLLESIEEEEKKTEEAAAVVSETIETEKAAIIENKIQEEEAAKEAVSESTKFQSSETDPDKLWELVEAAGSIEAYTFFVEMIDESPHIVDAYYMINTITHANDNPEQETETIINPVQYQNNTNGVVKEEVASVKEEIVETDKEANLWQNAITQNSLASYYSYLNGTTEKKYWAEAQEKITFLKGNAQNIEEKDWEETQSADTIDSYKEYIKKYPLGSYYAKAMFKINKLESS